ncbi:hypothetical protein Patl1_20675 [Pistacia atlantica]|uniref:Uncharacterized protein n=1 Tax=Pistacia atlantica TaxID=434234 RepID=A0ACC1BK02_9ROSI|nr:hypothetical protein Patl1_20675 [Pistacia atlantica]
MVLHGSGCPGLTLQSTAEKNPAWLDAAICVSNPCSLDNGPSSGKVSKGATGRLLKRCTAHVYISRLIQDLKIPEKKQKLSLQPNQVQMEFILTNDITCTTAEEIQVKFEVVFFSTRGFIKISNRILRHLEQTLGRSRVSISCLCRLEVLGEKLITTLIPIQIA